MPNNPEQLNTVQAHVSLNDPAPWDAIVIGASAAGLSAAQMLGRARRRTLVIDAGQPRNRFAAHMHGVLGNDGTPPAELIARGRDELTRYGVELVDGRATNVEASADLVTVTIDDVRVEQARALIVATGITDELPPIPGLAQRWGVSVLHCPYCHGWEVRDTRFAVIATMPMSLHQAELVRQWSDDVTFFIAGAGADTIDAAARRRLDARGIKVVQSPVAAVIGDGDDITAVQTADGASYDVDTIFTAGEAKPHDEFLAALDLDRADQSVGSFIAVNDFGQTSAERIWAVGNVVNPMANVPTAMAAGSNAGAMVNGFLVQEDVRAATNGDL